MPQKKTKNNPNKKTNFLGIFSIVVTIFSLPFLWHILLRSPTRSSHSNLETNLVCSDHFHNETYGNSTEVNTTLLGGLHGSSEKYTADCLESLIITGDHLLIEAPKNGEKVPCDFLHSSYARFNEKIECYGFDTSVTENRRTYHDLVYRVNFLANGGIFGKLFNEAKSEKELISSLEAFSKSLKNTNSLQKKYTSLAEKMGINPNIVNADGFDNKFHQRFGEYLKGFTQNIAGLNFEEINQFVLKEHSHLMAGVNHYDKLSRKGPTNEALVDEIKKHEKLLGGKHRLFVVAGASHTDISVNSHLKKFIKNRKKPIRIFQPKAYSPSPHG